MEKMSEHTLEVAEDRCLEIEEGMIAASSDQDIGSSISEQVAPARDEYVAVVINGMRYRLPRLKYDEIISGIGPSIAKRLAKRRWEDEAAEASSRRRPHPDYFSNAAGRRTI